MPEVSLEKVVQVVLKYMSSPENAKCSNPFVDQATCTKPMCMQTSGPNFFPKMQTHRVVTYIAIVFIVGPTWQKCHLRKVVPQSA